ncbi:MAG: biopolymer transporter ExbD [Bacteroidales bacterium]|jgi:biopolymer transport protein ExbD|nr:biopolymer transporter ExbD [Bacteroidales bacterium]
MADIQVEEKSRGGKKKPKKGDARVDMTPMVDLMSLLITFFMLTAAFSKPKVMEIVLPEKVRKNEKVEPPKIAESRTLNIILGPDDKVFWYPGKADPDVTVLQETDFSADGIRQVLLDRNRALFRKIDQFEKDVISGKIDIKQDSMRNAISQLKKDDDTGPIVLIKAFKTSKYKNFVDIIDEMSIVGIARYTFTEIDWIEEGLVVKAIGQTPETASGSAQ